MDLSVHFFKILLVMNVCLFKKKTESLSFRRTLMSLMCLHCSYHAYALITLTNLSHYNVYSP